MLSVRVVGFAILLGLVACGSASAGQAGKVLFAGGLGADGASALIYNAGTNKFAKKSATMNEGRWYNTATVLKNGKVLLVGGIDSPNIQTGNNLTSTELYNPRTGKFEKPDKTPTAPRSYSPTGTAPLFPDGSAATLLGNGKVLLVGGCCSPDLMHPEPRRTADLYDPATNSSSPAPDMNLPRTSPSAIDLGNGKALVVGGDPLIFNPARWYSTELYDEASNTFAAPSDTATMNRPRLAPALVQLASGKVLVVCGNDDASTELYDPTTNSFAPPNETPTLNVARGLCTATLLKNGKVLVAGGGGSIFGPNGSAIDSTEIYDPKTNSFSMGPKMTLAPVGIFGAGFASPGTTATLLK